MGIMRFDMQQFLTTAPNRGKTILLLGTAADGPVMTPTAISSPAQFEAVFGDSMKGDLGKAFLEVYRSNKSLDIHLMRISGTQAVGEIQTEAGVAISIKSKYGGSKYNYISIEFQISSFQGTPRNAMIVTMADQARTPVSRMVYYLDKYEYVNDLVQAVNADARRGAVPIILSTGMPFEPISHIWETNEGGMFWLLDGTDGLDLTKNQRYLALDDAYSLLEGYYIDIIVPVEAFFDDSHPVAFYGQGVYGTSYYASKRDYLSLTDAEDQDQIVSFHKQLITFCSTQQSFGIFTHGVIGLHPVEDPTIINRYPYSFIEKLVQVTAFKDRRGLSTTQSGQTVDYGNYISVVAGEFIYKAGTSEEYFNNFYLVYAAMVAGIFTDISTTNRPVPLSDISLRYEFSTEEIRDMADIGVVTFRNSVRKGIVVCNGVTAALSSSDMHYVSNVRMVQLTMSLVDQATQDLVGMDLPSVVMSKELDRVIGELLKYLASSSVGILKGYSFSTSWSQETQQGNVELSLMPRYAFEFTGSQVNFSSKG